MMGHCSKSEYCDAIEHIKHCQARLTICRRRVAKHQVTSFSAVAYDSLTDCRELSADSSSHWFWAFFEQQIYTNSLFLGGNGRKMSVHFPFFTQL